MWQARRIIASESRPKQFDDNTLTAKLKKTVSLRGGRPSPPGGTVAAKLKKTVSLRGGRPSPPGGTVAAPLVNVGPTWDREFARQ